MPSINPHNKGDLQKCETIPLFSLIFVFILKKLFFIKNAMCYQVMGLIISISNELINV